MIELLIEALKSAGFDFGFFRLINYITFRAIMGMATSLIICLVFGFKFIIYLYEKKFRDTSGEELSINAYSKRGTPTSGGLLIMISTILSLLLWADLRNTFFIIMVVGFIYFGLIGFIDDFQKTRFKSSLSGLSQIAKTFLMLAFIIPFSIFYLSPLNPVPEEIKTLIYLPFYKNPVLDLGNILFVLFILFTMFSIINAVNITDGMDGLLGGVSVLNIGVYSVFAYVIGNIVASSHLLFPYIRGVGEISVFGATLVGAILGFMWYNGYPAEIFMGDTGSLAIGCVLSMMILFIKQELLFLIAGGVFILEIFTSLLQEKLGNRLGRRVVYRAPFHHSLSHRGMAEPKVVIRLWIISLILALIALLSIKVR